MLQIEINTGEGGSIEVSGTVIVYIMDCSNAITAMCNVREPRLGGDKEKAVALMDVIYEAAMDAYRDGVQIVEPVKYATRKTLGELLAEDTE